jgi:Core-2/I-Branching enzyme
MATGKKLLANQLERTLQQSRPFMRNISVLAIALLALYLALKIGLLLATTGTTMKINLAAGWFHEGGVSETLSGRHRPVRRRQPVVFPVDSDRCSSEHLGMPPIVAARCNANGSSAFPNCNRLTCANLISGNPWRKRDAALYRDAIDFFRDQKGMSKSQHKHDSQAVLSEHGDLEIINATSTPAACAEFRRSRGFVERVDPEAADFPLAYNILLHAEAEQVARLLRAIYRPNNIYCLHVDRRSPEHFQLAIRSLAACFGNVKLASKPLAVVYAGPSRLMADINCMKDNVKSGVNWKYLFNTAGKTRSSPSAGNVIF